MYRLLILLFLISPAVKGQMQFWTKDDIIEKQFEKARKSLKIKTAYNFVTSEHWVVDDSTRYHEIFEYDKEGRKTVHKIYKDDWSNKTRYIQSIDSIYYDEKGNFKKYMRYTLKAGNEYYPDYKAEAVINGKGLIERINYYGGYYASEIRSYDIYTYNKKNQVIKIVKHDNDGTATYYRTFAYDKNDRLEKATAGVSLETEYEYILKYNSKGQLIQYTEYLEKEKQNESFYTYDAQNRPEKREYTTNYTYKDTFQYWYRDKEEVPYRTYLKYMRSSGKEGDYAHEFRVYKFEYF